MNIAICDDNKEHINILKNFIIKNDFIRENGRIAMFASGTELQSNLRSFFDVFFLDIDMPGINGIELGKLIRNENSNAFIVFVTSYPQYALEAFDCEAFHYLLKPINESKAMHVLNSLVHKYRRKNKYHLIRIKNQTIRIHAKDIYYIEYCRRHVIYHLKNMEYETVGRFSDVYEDLKDFGFYQIHQGYIVNMDKIIGFDKYSALLKDNKSVMISVRKRAEVLMAYAKYVEENK